MNRLFPFWTNVWHNRGVFGITLKTKFPLEPTIHSALWSNNALVNVVESKPKPKPKEEEKKSQDTPPPQKPKKNKKKNKGKK